MCQFVLFDCRLLHIEQTPSLFCNRKTTPCLPSVKSGMKMLAIGVVWNILLCKLSMYWKVLTKSVNSWMCFYSAAVLLFYFVLRSCTFFFTARKITIKKGLTDIKTTERETASFEVELSHSNVPGTWTRNGIQLKPTHHFRMTAKGQVHSLTISNLSIEDTGTFTFCVENLKTSARLVVKGESFIKKRYLK